MMTMDIWMCPKCNKPTSNWRKCPTCHTQAVCTTFSLWPLESRLADDPQSIQDRKQAELRKQKAQSKRS